ncbi:hypothetical protein M2165_003788 [Variovorax sp. TBS-050B]|uniref:hypothetical protein n=1 Tax=Variovorax sp. TBS-050B TaxID=2940551 RepID=UPI002473FE1F|nr:hypothetical protein [Variovorax sp. TBS-050B]MDH6593899.1 hypothetical protein [Variovorax sp. TBS-050B]
MKRSSVWEDVISSYRSHHMDVAQNRTIPPEVMRLLCQHGNEAVRATWADKRRLPEDLLRSLSDDPSSLVRKKIAANAKSPIDSVKKLALGSDEDVARVAMFRLKSSDRVKRGMARSKAVRHE